MVGQLQLQCFELVVETVRWKGGGGVDQWSVSFSFSVSNLAIMNSHVIIIVFLFVLNCAAIDPPSHEFRVRTHEGSKTIVQDGVKKKISVMRVFWSLVEGDYMYGKKRIIGKREHGEYR